MEMKIKANEIRGWRQARAWSQQHLADASGISLRTVQRIEKTGQASPESAKAIAASFGVGVSELVESVNDRAYGWWRPRFLIGIPAVVGALVSWMFVATLATAEPVMLEASFSSDGEELADLQLLTDTGKSAEVILEDGWKVRLVPTMTPDGQVRIAAEIYEQGDEPGDWSLVSSPVLITESDKAGEVRYDGENGSNLNFVVTPR